MPENIWPDRKKDQIFWVLLTLALIALVTWLFVLVVSGIKKYEYIGRPEAQRDMITITGEGKVTAIPDVATVQVGVVTEKSDVATAQTENTTKMNKLLAELRGLGIDSADIQTSSYNIYPQYDYIDGRSMVRGYEVSQNVQIKIRDVKKVGDVISKAGSLGANQIGGLQFTIDDPEMLRQEARVKALENARMKAQALANIAGIRLGKVVSFSESDASYNPYPMYYDMKSYATGLGGGEAAPTISEGSLDVKIFATVSYEIK